MKHIFFIWNERKNRQRKSLRNVNIRIFPGRIWNWQEYISTFAFLPDCIKTENRRQDVCAASFYRKRIVSCSLNSGRK